MHLIMKIQNDLYCITYMETNQFLIICVCAFENEVHVMSPSSHIPSEFFFLHSLIVFKKLANKCEVLKLGELENDKRVL